MRKIFFVILCSIMFLQFVSAVDTTIKIDTLPNHDLRLNFLNPDLTSGTISFETKKIATGETGIVEYTFSGSAVAFNLRITLIDNGTTEHTELVNDVVAGETLYAMFIPGAIEITKNYQGLEVEEPVIEETQTNETEEANESSEEIPTVSGGVVDGEAQTSEEGFKFSNFFKFFRISGFASSENGKSSAMKFVYYGVGFVFLLAIAFFVFKMKKNSGVGGKFKNDEDELGDAQRKIDEAEQEIREVRRRRVGI